MRHLVVVAAVHDGAGAVMRAAIGGLGWGCIGMHFDHSPVRLARRHDHSRQALQGEADEDGEQRNQPT